MEKLLEMAPNEASRIIFLLIQTLPTFWATRILILRIFIFWIFWIQNFQISRFPDFQKSGLGRAGPLGWAGGVLGRAGGPSGGLGGPSDGPGGSLRRAGVVPRVGRGSLRWALRVGPSALSAD